MKNEDFDENKFYIPFPDLTSRQENWFVLLARV